MIYYVYISGAGTYPAKRYKMQAATIEKAIERSLKRHRRRNGLEDHCRRLLIQVAWGTPIDEGVSDFL